jgi:hypothetical protein
MIGLPLAETNTVVFQIVKEGLSLYRYHTDSVNHAAMSTQCHKYAVETLHIYRFVHGYYHNCIRKRPFIASSLPAFMQPLLARRSFTKTKQKQLFRY